MVLLATSVCYSSNPSITLTSTVLDGDKAKLQSYNYSHMYVRNANFDVRIDDNVTPETDAQWVLVPGLANSKEGYVSIQSANHPGYYLRHWNYDFRLEKNDGTAIFAEDATFKMVPGLADPSYTSFQSYNYPNRYIRHYDYLLRLDEIVTALDREDATFRVIDGSSVDPDKPDDSVIVTNPIVRRRADPWVYRHTDGYYYMTASVPEYDRIELRRAKTLQGLSTATPKTIWRRHSSGIMGGHIWAPEIHFIDGKWYIYFSAGTSSNYFDIRLYVLECQDSNPLTGTWVEKGQLKTNWESFTLDATTFEHNGTRYLVWAQKDPKIASNSNIYIAKMNGPLAITGSQVMIASPHYSWEKVGYAVNEGPAVLKKNGKIFITFSASATDSNYCMGLLTASDTANLLDPKSWYKSPNPVFQSNTSTGQYGPGHNSFTTSPDGKVDIMVYHARNYRDITGDPLYDPNRHTRAQIVNWNADGTPDFGIPVADGTNVIYIPPQTPTPTPIPTNSATPNDLIYGDINGDNSVNSTDLTALKRYLLGRIAPTAPNWRLTSDLNLDGNINSTDLTILKRYILGRIKALPWVD
ncbi:family 43 glycosylhydrolase [Acetivibrio straminisolvens]|uniref:family 43 glycosylhydrolase n=1 Tax=Acetivibrio straminisolvens TaxID=253314 RepID=UPI002240CFA6|nr:family 43 glycosylhydrolase [Acetivibrio straminisolvens]